MVAALLTASLCCFLSKRTWKRSKSERAALLCLWAIFWAQADLAHLASISEASHFLATAEERAARGSLATTWGVKTTWARATPWRGTPVVGPSMRTWKNLVSIAASKNLKTVECQKYKMEKRAADGLLMAGSRRRIHHPLHVATLRPGRTHPTTKYQLALLSFFDFRILSWIRYKTYSLVVDDLNNGGELTSVSTLVDQDNTANFNKSPVGSLDGSLCRHFCCEGWVEEK